MIYSPVSDFHMYALLPAFPGRTFYIFRLVWRGTMIVRLYNNTLENELINYVLSNKVFKYKKTLKIKKAGGLHRHPQTNKEAPTLSEADQRSLISLYYIHLGAPPPKEWNGEGGSVSVIVRALNYGKDQGERGHCKLPFYHSCWW
jgi:hypothetical protein